MIFIYVNSFYSQGAVQTMQYSLPLYPQKKHVLKHDILTVFTSQLMLVDRIGATFLYHQVK